MNRHRVEELIRELIAELGEDPTREGLLETPRRVTASYEYFTSGYRTDIDKLINNAIFTQLDETNNMIIARDIELYSLCEHHMLPFYGRCHIGYLPNGKVLGLSKLARMVDMFARRLQIQERLTDQIARAIMDAVNPLGVGVIIEARHLCMMMRGAQKQNSMMVTSSMLGSFRKSSITRSEFLALLQREKPV
jgi:GTP cyclohydrolase I